MPNEFVLAADCDDSDFEDRVKALLLYRKVVSAKIIDEDEIVAELTLDNGTVLRACGTQGCGGCCNGWTFIEDLNTCENAITNVECTASGDMVEEAIYRIFVFAENKKIKLLELKGYDNGYYGFGYWLEVKRCEGAA